MVQEAIPITSENEPLQQPLAGRGNGSSDEQAHLPDAAEASQEQAKEATGAYRQWRLLRREIPELQATAEKNSLWIESALHDYRLTCLELTYRLEQVEAEIWELYHQVREEYPRLQKATARKPLIFSSRSRLVNLRDQWKALIERQVKLIDTLNSAPESQRFYNTTQLLRKHLAEEHARREEAARRVRMASDQLEHALEQLNERSAEFESVASGSRILRLEDAQKVWRTRLEEFRSGEISELTNAEELVRKIHLLNETVREAPISARWIRATEVKFARLIESNELLASLGKAAISQDEQARMTTILYEHVPRLWLNGDNAELGRHLQALEKFISFYEEVIKRELDFAEKRRPGITRALSMSLGRESFDLEQVTLLTRSLVHALDERDRFMRGHSEEVTRLALQTARRLNWTSVDLEFLELAGLLHDLGKLAIPENVLSKISPLTADERTLIEKHPVFGANLVKPVKGLQRIVPWIYHHQERWDGQGYPDRLSRKDIPLGASIIAVAEAYATMTTDKPYQPALSPAVAIETIQEEAGKQFHPEVVEAFVEAMNSSTGMLEGVEKPKQSGSERP